MLAMSRMGMLLVLLLVTSVLLYLAIKGIRSGRVRGRGGIYTEEENFVMFWITIGVYFFLAGTMLVGLLVAVFAP
ncbi:hypothetical protein [Prosthecobacter fluviatilis]|uniref:Uncharacterized protein n=1 Tax=Prosthecobacter fluviatilis TaxID=445931 RepID=A0ABW0KZ88_9BACT